MASNEDNAAIHENPYLALRAEKIKRNEARLRELGLLTVKSNSPRPRDPSQPDPRLQARKKAPPSTSPVVSLRRSKRLLDQPHAEPIQENGTTSDRVNNMPKRPRVVTPPNADERRDRSKVTKSDPNSESPAPPKPPSPNSVRGISLCTKHLVLGSEDAESGERQAGLLGAPMQQTGKEFVIYKSFEVAASVEDQRRLEGSRLSFNKYSGVQEWEDCIFLWVNLYDKNNAVVNEFLDDGRQITWFGGSRMVDDTQPLVGKLIRWGKDATDASSRIVLWCRRFDTLRKTYGPYVCLGRLAYHAYEPGSYPLAFVWNLLDSHRLRNHEDPQIRSNFQSMIDVAS